LIEGELVLYSEKASIFKHMPVAMQMFKKGKIAMPWNIPVSKNHDEIKKLIKSSSTLSFRGKGDMNMNLNMHFLQDVPESKALLSS